MEEKSTKIKYTRKKKNTQSAVAVLTEAQKIAFAPFTFQVVASMLDFGIIQALSKASMSKKQIMDACKVSRYTVDTLFDAAICIGLIEQNQDNTSTARRSTARVHFGRFWATFLLPSD